MNRSNFVIIIPIKSLALAKSRLSNVMTKNQRFNITVNMFLEVIKASKKSLSNEVWVIGKDKIFKDICNYFNATWIQDEGYGLNNILNDKFSDAFKKQLTPIYIASDLPFIEFNDINMAIDLSNYGKDFVFSPAYNDKGTNLIIAPVLSDFLIKLGDNSLEKHTGQVIESNLNFSFCKQEGLGFDLDTVEDLNYFQKIRPGIINKLMNKSFLEIN
ncbi:MAG: 2-phospho-L-lactate guanylyltransferase [Dehalococcoidia bacterium]